MSDIWYHILIVLKYLSLSLILLYEYSWIWKEDSHDIFFAPNVLWVHDALLGSHNSSVEPGHSWPPSWHWNPELLLVFWYVPHVGAWPRGFLHMFMKHKFCDVQLHRADTWLESAVSRPDWSEYFVIQICCPIVKVLPMPQSHSDALQWCSHQNM